MKGRRLLLWTPYDDDTACQRPLDAVHAAVVIMQYPEMSLIEQFGITQEIRFPYISGLLAFREGGPLIQLFHKIEKEPDLILFHAPGSGYITTFF